MDEVSIDKVLEKISLIFGTDSLDIVLPANMLVDFSIYSISNIDRSDLEGEAVYQSKVYMLFATLLSFVSEKYTMFDAEVKRLEASISLEYERRINGGDETLIKLYGSRISDKKIEKLVDSDERIVEAINNKLKYKNMVTTFSNLVDGLSKRSDMLIQLISKRKREQEQGVA